jgi:hypothetical protein
MTRSWRWRPKAQSLATGRDGRLRKSVGSSLACQSLRPACADAASNPSQSAPFSRPSGATLPGVAWHQRRHCTDPVRLRTSRLVNHCRRFSAGRKRLNSALSLRTSGFRCGQELPAAAFVGTVIRRADRVRFVGWPTAVDLYPASIWLRD